MKAIQNQQTVKLAIDCATGEIVAAEALLALSEIEFTSMRREAMAARLDRRRGGSAMRFKCAICEHPLYLSRHIQGHQNRWFTHDGKSENCPWYEGARLTPDQTKALIYRGQQEGLEHREAKQFLATWLSRDPLVSGVNQEKTTFGEVLKGEWRRPDVKCLYRGMPLVFEIQLSYTFLSDVIARDEFYRHEGIFIVWVFAKFDLRRAAVTDEAFFNRRNLFVLDAAAKQSTAERNALTFSGYRQTPVVGGEGIHDVWEAHPISLNKVAFPRETMRPYFFDYEAERQRLETARADAWLKEQQDAWTQGIRDYLEAALRYYESDYADKEKEALLHVVTGLSENTSWHPRLEKLRDARFFGYHCVLPVLLSIQQGRSLGYSKQFSVYQVMEAGLRSGSRIGQHAFAILYLWAYKTYRPTMSLKHRTWLSDYGHRIKRSLDAGEDTYRRDTAYDEVAGLLFPELQGSLTSSFGIDRQIEIQDEAD